MRPISEYTLDWMDAHGWCWCKPPKDHCESCKQQRQEMRQQLARKPQPTVYRGQAPVSKRLDWE
jgi:hypothetical protein